MKNKKKLIFKYVLLAFTIAINFFILISGFVDAKGSAKEASPFIDAVENIVNAAHPGAINAGNKAAIDYDLRKLLGHFVLTGISGVFSTLTLIVFLHDSKLKNLLWPLPFSAVFGFVISTLSEIAQLTQESRVSSFNDVLIDYAGYVIGLIVVYLIVIIVLETMIENNRKSKR